MLWCPVIAASRRVICNRKLTFNRCTELGSWDLPEVLTSQFHMFSLYWQQSALQALLTRVEANELWAA